MPGEKTEPVEQEALRPSLSALFARLFEEGGAFLRAEMLLYRAQATRKAFSAGMIVALIGAAIMLLQAVIVVVLGGLLMILAPIVGTGWALLIVAASTLILIGGCVLIARAKVATLLKPQDPS
jgi:hypothetical protein